MRPPFRASLAGHGFTLDTDTGEIAQLAAFVGPFSARAAQIGRNIDRYEATWRAAHPGAEPGPRVRRSWDARAWADDRPDKVVPREGTDLTQRWVQELTRLGYHDPNPSPAPSPTASPTVQPTRQPCLDGAARPVRVGTVDRDAAAGLVLTRLGAARSGWNAADVRGQVEQLIAAAGIVASGPARSELAEDLTARALAGCVPLLGRRGVPEHIRALTSTSVLDVEADLNARFIARAGAGGRAYPHTAYGQNPVPTGWGWPGLDAGQRQVVAALAGTHDLLVVEGAAGAGKTTTLAATKTVLQQQGRRLVVVTPTLQAARIAADQVGAPAFSAAWLAHQHGHRWDNDGQWTELLVGDRDPRTGHTYPGPTLAAVLYAGDLLLVDEAGMLDQDTARALLVIADTQHARVALVGDRHQLPAVGRGGVLDLACTANPTGCMTLDAVHRFADPAYAELTLSMRTGTPQDPGEVFDALLARGEIRIYPTAADCTGGLATIAAAAAATRTSEGTGKGHGWTAGLGVLLVADTREQVVQLNATVRDRLVADGYVDDANAVTTWAGERVGVGDQITTRRNDPTVDVANRDTWTVTGLQDPDDPDEPGALVVVGSRGRRVLPPGYVRDHVELAYASTVYGAQGATIDTAHLLVGEHTGAASAYVAMTRGRHTNTAHLIADTPQEAREQWIEVFTRDRADLGPAHAARLAAREASSYAPHQPRAAALSKLRDAWSTEQAITQDLAAARTRYKGLAQVVPLRAQHDALVADARSTFERARQHTTQATAHAEQLKAAVDRYAFQLAQHLTREWDTARPGVSAAAQTVRAGSGIFGQHRGAVRRANRHLHEWGERWRPIVGGLPTDAGELVAAAAGLDDAHLQQAFSGYAGRVADGAHPDQAPADAAAHTARLTATLAWDAYQQTCSDFPALLDGDGRLGHLVDSARHLARSAQDVADLVDHLEGAHARVSALLAEPALRSLPPDRIETERQSWATAHWGKTQQKAPAAVVPDDAPSLRRSHRHDRSPAPYTPTPSSGMSR